MKAKSIRIRPLLIACYLTILACGLTITNVSAANPENKPTINLPEYQFLRYDENWSVLKQATPAEYKADFWNRIKYIPINSSGSYWTSFGGQLQYRGENWHNWNFDTTKDTSHLGRVLLHSDTHLGEHIRVFIEGKSALAAGRDLPGNNRTLDVDALDLQQAFVDFTTIYDNKIILTLRPGRQAYSFGQQRLVSPGPWTNTLNTFDGITAIAQGPFWKATAFTSRYVPVREYKFNTNDASNKFGGIYLEQAINEFGLNTEAYWLDHRRDSATFNDTTGHENRHTIGTHLFGLLFNDTVDYDLEGAYQYGTLDTIGIRAYMVAAEVGYQFKQLIYKPRLIAGYDYASGGETNSGKAKTFSQLFPLGHKFLGWADLVGRQNIKAKHAGVIIQPLNPLELGVVYHTFRRASGQDALYNAWGVVQRADSSNASLAVGDEWDSFVKYTMDKHATWLLGYNQFNAGQFIKETGNSRNVKFGYLQLIYMV